MNNYFVISVGKIQGNLGPIKKTMTKNVLPTFWWPTSENFWGQWKQNYYGLIVQVLEMELRLSYILEILEIQQQYQFWWTGPGTEVKLFQIQMFELNLHWYIVIYKLQVLGLWWKYSKIQMLEFIHGLCPHFSGTSGVSTMLDNFHKQDGTLIYHTNIYIHTKGSHPLKILKFYEKKTS